MRSQRHGDLLPFALFSGDYYYPAGGWGDFVGCYESMEDALGGFIPSEYAWAHVVDLRELREVARVEGRSDWRVL